MVFPGAYSKIDCKASPRVRFRVKVMVTSKIQDF